MRHEDVEVDPNFTMTPFTFHAGEFQALHAEINVKLNNIEQNVRFLMGGVAAIWAWLLTEDRLEGHPESLLPYLPLVFTALFGILILRQMRFVGVQGEYLSSIENECAHPHLGWERYRVANDRTGEWGIHKFTLALLMVLQGVAVVWGKRVKFAADYQVALAWLESWIAAARQMIGA